MKTISIITPLYKGKKFINPLLEILEECGRNASGIANVEWVISNDDPEDYIENDLSSDILSIIILNTNINRGIQGARVVGLEKATGEYVLFLDQDDELDENWIVSQLSYIGASDGVVCDCRFDGIPFYNGWDRPDLETCITKEYNVKEKNGFVPGQVLIRKSSIPSIWKENWLKWNACDDQLLWLCMFGQGAVFVSNKETCYYHNRSGNNQSRNLPERYMSNREMIELLKSKHVLSEEDIEALTESRDNETIHYLSQNAAQKKKIEMYEKILGCYENNGDEWLNKELEFRQGVAIYGVSLGVHIYRLLTDIGVKIECFIDRNNEQSGVSIPIVDNTHIPNGIKTIINTLIMEEEKIGSFLSDNYPDIKVINIRQLFDE